MVNVVKIKNDDGVALAIPYFGVAIVVETKVKMRSILNEPRVVRLIINGRANLSGRLKRLLRQTVRDLGEWF